jgi:3-oxoadipate enol-lactonase
MVTPSYAAKRPEVRSELREMLVGTPAAGYAACCGAIERMDLRWDLAAINAPTLVVSGSEDPATTPEVGAQIAEAIRGARHEVVESAAHLAAVEQPRAVNRLILEHLT